MLDDDINVKAINNVPSLGDKNADGKASTRNIPVFKETPQDTAENNSSSDSLKPAIDDPQPFDYHDPDYFPDGGVRAWLMVLCAFLASFMTWGMTTSFGVFTTYYQTVLLTDSSSFQIGWISSVQTGLIFLGGLFTGKLFDAGYFIYLELFGAIVTFVCFMLIAQSTEYYQIFLAQGIGLGLGMGATFSPALACLGGYFKVQRRTLLMSACTTGSGFGGVIFPIITNNLLYRIGFPWTIRVLAFVELALYLVILACMRDRIPRSVRQARLAANSSVKSNSFFAISSWVDMTALRDPVFCLLAVGLTLCFLVVFTPFSYIESFAVHLNVPSSLSMYIISVLGAASVFGRISTYYCARWIGPLTWVLIVAILSSVCLYTWALVDDSNGTGGAASSATIGGLLAFVVIYGILSGILNAFPPLLVPYLTPEISRLGVRLGMIFFGLGIANIFSIPFAGLVLGPDHDKYKDLAYFCGSIMMAGSVFLVLCRLARGGLKLERI